jgi:hypothetical protein
MAVLSRAHAAHVRIGELIAITVIAVIACGLYFSLFGRLAAAAYNWSTIVGLLFSLLLLYIAIIATTVHFWLIETETWNNSNLVAFVATLPSLSIFLCVALASLAYGFSQLDIAHYDVHDPLSVATLSRHYLWNFVDMIPGLDVWKTLGIHDPVEERGVLSGMLLIGFRLMVIVVIFKTVEKAAEQLIKSPNHPRTAPLAKGAETGL